MVYYTDSPKINRRMVAGYYLFLCLVGFAVLLGPTGAGIPITLIGTDGRDHELAYPGDHTDPGNCDTCHADEYDYWNETNHAQHIFVNESADADDPNGVRIGPNPWGWQNKTYFNSSCSECHTSGWANNSGVISFDSYGVNCFACHNSTGYVDYSGDACTTCHTTHNPEHPSQWFDYTSSAHANSLTDMLASGHPGSYCMHCMSSEAFVYQQNPDMIGSEVNTTFDPHGDYNAISCPTCHSVHANWSADSPAMIRAVNATQLCAECHVGTRHTTYNIWYGGSHHLAGVECTDCHGFDIAPGDNEFMNHTWAVDPEVACGQSDCHDGSHNGIPEAEWAIHQLEMQQEAFDALVEEIYAEADALRDIVETYNETDGADHELVAEVVDVIDEVETIVGMQEGDLSGGFHDSTGIMEALNGAYADLLEAKAYFYENTPADTVTVTETETVTVTVGGTLFGLDSNLVLMGGAVGGIVIGLILGILVGRRQ